MKALSILIITVCLAVLVPRPNFHQKGKQSEAPIWSSISVNELVFIAGSTANLQIYFTLVNDGAATIDPEIGASEIIVNGKTWADSYLIFGNGPRDNRFTALPPKDYLLFGYALGERFNEPGIYRVSWCRRARQNVEI
jgi:hypothetical protein